MRDTVQLELIIDDLFFAVEFERVTTFDSDPSYGADADGHRGQRVTFIDSDEAQNVIVEGRPIEAYPLDLQKKIEDEIARYMIKNDPDVENDDYR